MVNIMSVMHTIPHLITPFKSVYKYLGHGLNLLTSGSTCY